MGPTQGVCMGGGGGVRCSPLPAAASWQGKGAELHRAGAGQVHQILAEGSRSVGLG